MHNSPTKAVVLMSLSAFFSGMVFYAPLATLYRQHRGITVWQMSIIESVSLALMMALELPWGYIADRIGYRRTLILSFSFLFVSKIVFFGANNFFLFLLERILLAIAFSALSGVDIAYLHQCKAGHKELAQYQGSMFLGLFAVALVFPLFTEVYTQSALLTIGSHLCALLFILLLPREGRAGEASSLPKRSLVKTITALVRNKPLLLYVGGNSMLFGINQVVTLLLVQLCYLEVGLPLSLFGIPFLLLTGISSAGSLLSAPFVARIGALPATVSAFFLSFAGLLLLSSLHAVVVVLVGAVLVRVGAVLVQPLYFSVTAKASDGAALATALSLNSLVGSCMELVLTLILGFLAETNLALSLLIAGGLLIGALGTLWYSRSILHES